MCVRSFIRALSEGSSSISRSAEATDKRDFFGNLLRSPEKYGVRKNVPNKNSELLSCSVPDRLHPNGKTSGALRVAETTELPDAKLTNAFKIYVGPRNKGNAESSNYYTASCLPARKITG